MREDNGRVNALGLFDLDRRIRPVGEAFRKIVSEWEAVLPTQSVCLRVPVYAPSQSEWAGAQDQWAAPAAAPTEPANTEGGR